MPPQPFLSSISPPTGEGQKRQDLSEKINLDLGIGSSSYSSYVSVSEEGVLEEKKNEIIIIKPEEEQEKRESLLFSAYQQIFSYNLAVPFHLFLPIWISLFSSCGSHHIYNQYPSCDLSGFTPRNSKHNIMNDPEPGRCRRTDGRKWRCSQNAIADKKYCERHMHRGRTGSRKHVESSGNVSRLDSKTSTQDDDRMQTISLVTSDIDNRISDSISDLNLSLSDSNCSVPAFAKCRGESQDLLSVVQTPKDAFGRGNEFNKDVNNGTTNRSISSEDKCNGFENEIPRKVISRKRCPQNNRGALVSPGFGSSPDTVLQCATDKISLTLGAENITENEGRRCRRTDGKKWQCSKNAVPNQKYCEAHMHRGTKRRVSNPESAHFASTRKARFSGPRPVCPYNVINLNSMPVSPQRSMGGNSTDSSSDATTISDENVSFWRAKSVISS